MKKHYITIVLSFFMLTAWSQEYRRMIIAGTYTVQEIQAEAEAYFAIVGTERGKGYKPYKRWEYNALRNMDENNMLKTPDFYFNELEAYNKYINENSSFANRTTTGNWEELGPSSWNATSGWNPGVGRITSIAVEETNTDHIIIGAVAGGVWKTTDGGVNWTVLTDNLSNIYVYSLTIHPTNPLIYFWGSRNGVIFRSIDGGLTWNTFSDTGGGNVNKILIDPTDTTKMYCSVEGGGLYKSTNSGANWSLITAGANNGYDVEFKPGDTSVIYASGNDVYRSTDGGVSFSIVNDSGINAFSSGAKMMGVSPADPTVVFVLEASGSLFGGFYKSVDSGATFTELNHGGNNYFGYSSTANDNRGQAPRDMDIAISPIDIDEVHIAGINTWRSTDGGVSFDISSQWTPGGASGQNIGYCHADVDLLMFVGTDLYAGTDGGIFVAEDTPNLNSTYYRDLTAGLGIRQFYKIGISQSDPVIVSGGSQDNGTSFLDTSGNWSDWLGADGMETFIDKSNSDIFYGTTQFGSLYKSTTGGNSYFGLTEPGGGSGNWVTPFEQDPITDDAVYVGYRNVYKSINGGSTWTSISQNFGTNLNHLKIAPSDNLTMYASRGSSLYKTDDGGATNWSILSGFSGSINSIAIHPTDPDKVAIATSSAQKVYVSTNGGSTWTSYLNDLPNFSALALVWQDNGNDGLYVGMNYGIYYIDNTFANWQPFSNNLPNAEVSELEINTANNKIYASTFGRGLWASDVYQETLSTDDFILNSISIHPNPAQTEINVLWDKSQDVNIRIYDAMGKLVHYNKNQSLINGHTINISSYASGLYYIKINDEQGFVTKKIIKQ